MRRFFLGLLLSFNFTFFFRSLSLYLVIQRYVNLLSTMSNA